MVLMFFFLLFSYGQYLASTLPTNSNEQNVNLNQDYNAEEEEELHLLKTTINQRNTLLDVLIHLLLESNQIGVNTQ